MATLIAVYTSDGCVGRCDAKCYDAAEPACDCVCGGMNHGAGQTKAVENTRELAETWIEEYARDKGLQNYRGLINSNVVDQLSLFDVENLADSICPKNPWPNSLGAVRYWFEYERN